MDYTDKLDMMDDDCDIQGYQICKDPIIINFDYIYTISDEELVNESFSDVEKWIFNRLSKG